MRSKILFLSFNLLFMFCSNSMQAQNKPTKPGSITSYHTLWMQVKTDENQSLPQSAGSTVEVIYQKALTEKNSPELIKSLIHKIKYSLVIDQNQFPQVIREVESYTEQTKNATEQSVLYSVLANLYWQYFQSNSYLIANRTAIIGYIPEDIREWSGNLFVEKIAGYVHLSLKEKNVLQQTKASEYKAILQPDDNSGIDLTPTLYDLLVNEGINIVSSLSYDYQVSRFAKQTRLTDDKYFQEARQFAILPISSGKNDFVAQTLKLYQSWISFHLNDKDEEILLQTDLARYNFVFQKTESPDKVKYYMSALDGLEKRYSGNPLCVEVLYQKAQTYNNYPDDDGEVIPFEVISFQKRQNEQHGKAYEICQEGIRKYPNYKRINLLKNLSNQLTGGFINSDADNTIYPGTEWKLKLSYRNIPSVVVEIYKISAPVTAYIDEWEAGQYRKGTLVQKTTIELKNEFPYQTSDTTLKFPVKDKGLYEFVIRASDKEISPINNKFSVSSLTAVARTYSDQQEILIVDRLSGKPIESAQVNLYKRNERKYIPAGQLLTNKDGIAVSNKIKDVDFYQVSIGGDSAMSVSYFPWDYYSYSQTPNEEPKLSLFTDRSIYRPGQPVYFKGIAYKSTEKESAVIPNANYDIALFDVNGKEIATKKLKTNEFGSFSGEFTLPQQALNGSFSIGTKNYDQRISFRVEEYKRPRFDIKFTPIDKTYRFGDQVTLKGEAKTFSGVNMGQIPVTFRIVKRPHWIWLRAPRYAEVQVAEGEVKTNDDGQFEISFKPEKDFSDNQQKEVYYTYEVQVSVTDESGESQESSTNFSVGDKSMYLQTTGLDGNVNKDQLSKVVIDAYNLNGKKLSSKGSYKVYSLTAEESLDKTLESKDWKINQLVASGDFTSGDSISINALSKVASGQYRLIAVSKDDAGREVTLENDFTLYSMQDKRPPVVTYEWIRTTQHEFAPGETATILFGSSAKEVYAFYDIFKDGKKLESHNIQLNNESKQVKIPFKESYGDGVTVIFTFIKNERLFTQNVELTRKKESDKLTVKLDVFRDKLLPGQKEEWRISVKDEKSKPVQAELLSGMFDASLEKINPHSWYFSPEFSSYHQLPSWMTGNDSDNRIGRMEKQLDYLDVPGFSYKTFNWFGLNFYSRTLRAMSGRMGMGVAVTEAKMDTQDAVANAPESPSPRNKSKGYDAGFISPVAVKDESLKVSEAGAGKASGNENVQVRQNFNETAFFYPQLRTNESGETVIAFTVPESNTTWKFMVLAHTKELKYGEIVAEAISQKKLMVSPNMPRFIRNGDKTTISSNISNLSDATLSGSVSISFADPVNGKENINVPGSTQKFTVEKGKTTNVTWSFEVPSSIDITACTIIAQTENFSDGEKHLLPVLPNRMLVTESLPIDMPDKGSKQFTFDKLLNNNSKSLENYRLTVEFSGNPVWYAIQALPAMTSPANDDVLSWFSAYYSNTLAVRIANSTPKVKQMIEVWTKQNGSKESLVSSLEKNQELKATLLEETPWVMEAKSETEQKQRLALLFDLNRTENLSQTALNKLQELQSSDGGWSWFKGMSSSPAITQWILYGSGELNKGKDASPATSEMLAKAVRFVDQQFKKQFDQWKKYDKNWKTSTSISTYQIEYLFVRTYYKDIPFDDADEAARFYSTILEKYWTKNTGLYERAIAAMYLQRTGKTATANSIIQSLREHATQNPEMGMYWANNNATAFLFQSATSVHTFIMQAFQEMNAPEKEMNELKRWLLKQKQTQLWESVPATVNAVVALVQTGSNQLDNNGDFAITLGKTPVNTSSKEAGTAYIKQSFDAASITPEMGKISVSKQDPGPAWGALYWQYFEDLDKITQAKTGLNVEKKLFVEKTTSTGKVLNPVTPTQPLQVGDKAIVRLTIRNDRDMEYVMLKDMRAACFEPSEQLSGTKWKDGVIYYQTTKDASTNFYFSHLPKGTYVFEYPVYVTRTGEYSGGNSTIQCMYAPEFISHSAGEKVTVK